MNEHERCGQCYYYYPVKGGSDACLFVCLLIAVVSCVVTFNNGLVGMCTSMRSVGLVDQLKKGCSIIKKRRRSLE